jgi:histidinol-phosphate aminotransferase
MDLNIPNYIVSIDPYSPGKPLKELEREYGISDSIKLASNENPLGPSPKAVEAVKNVLGELNRYPDAGGHDLIRKISQTLGTGHENIVLGNGSDEIIGLLAKALLQVGDEVIVPWPSFLMYDIMVRSVGAVPAYVPLNDSLCIDLESIQNRITPKTRMVFLCNPNNPTGTVFSKSDFERFLDNIPNIVVVLDEAYIEFVQDETCAKGIDYINSDVMVVTLRTFSKAYGLAGIRIGYGVMPQIIANLVNRIRPPFNANSLAQVAAMAALGDREFLQKTLDLVKEGMSFLLESLRKMGVEYFSSQANFFLINVKQSADEVFEKMLRQGVIVRSMKAYGYPEYIRINVGLPDENIRFIKALEKVI